MDPVEPVLGRHILDDGDAARIRANDDIIYKQAFLFSTPNSLNKTQKNNPDQPHPFTPRARPNTSQEKQVGSKNEDRAAREA